MKLLMVFLGLAAGNAICIPLFDMETGVLIERTVFQAAALGAAFLAGAK